MGYQFSMRLLAYITSFVFFVSLVGCNYNSSNSALCVDQILSIKKIPIKPYLGYDEGYDYFLEHTNDADVRACLVNNITNETIIKDPFGTPGPRSNVVIGDVAYSILSGNFGLDYRENLPDHIREDYDRNGYFAYYHYVQTDANGRNIIQESVINYYKNQK